MNALAAPSTSREPWQRERNNKFYRLAHWPLWIAVFFLVPGPLVFELFARGFDPRLKIWLALVILFTAIAGWFGRLPGTEAKPYILRFTEDKPNPLYRRICYTVAWSDLLTFAVMNLAGLVDAAASGHWHLRQIYDSTYFVFAVAVWVWGAVGQLPRTRTSTKGENGERRYFYATVWAVVAAQSTLALLWRILPRSHFTDLLKLAAFVFILAIVGRLAGVGRLPRTQPSVYGDWAISD